MDKGMDKDMVKAAIMSAYMEDKEKPKEKTSRGSGNFTSNRTEQEKEETKKKNLQYIKEYNKERYVKLYLNVEIEDKIKFDTQAELNEMSLQKYFSKILNEDTANYDKEEFEALFEEKKEKLTSAYKNNSVLEMKRSIKQKEREELIEIALKEAWDYFGKDPLKMPKKNRAEFIVYKRDHGMKKGGIQAYCDAMQITRAWYYAQSNENKKKNSEES